MDRIGTISAVETNAYYPDGESINIFVCTDRVGQYLTDLGDTARWLYSEAHPDTTHAMLDALEADGTVLRRHELRRYIDTQDAIVGEAQTLAEHIATTLAGMRTPK